MNSGYYPFYLEDKEKYHQKILRVIEKVIFEDIKILYNKDNRESEEDREIISVHMAGNNATELIHEYLLAAQLNEGLETIHHTLHAHPTLSEGIWESASACINRGLHV